MFEFIKKHRINKNTVWLSYIISYQEFSMCLTTIRPCYKLVLFVLIFIIQLLFKQELIKKFKGPNTMNHMTPIKILNTTILR